MKPEQGFLIGIGLLITIGATLILTIILPPTSQFKAITYIAAAVIIITMLAAERAKTKKTKLNKKK